MASSKNLCLLLGLLFAMVLLISSASSEKSVKEANDVEEVKYGGGHGHGNGGAYRRILQVGACPNGCCRSQRVFRCLRCCRSDESPDDIKN